MLDGPSVNESLHGVHLTVYAMGKLYELITGTDLNAATMSADKQKTDGREPRVIYLQD
jgi:hypothetical protein